MHKPKKTTTFYGRQPGEKSHWSGEAAGPWKPVAPTKVVEVRYDHFGDGRFRHGCNLSSSARRQVVEGLPTRALPPEEAKLALTKLNVLI